MDYPISFGSSPFYFHSEQINNASLSPTPPVQLRQKVEIRPWGSLSPKVIWDQEEISFWDTKTAYVRFVWFCLPFLSFFQSSKRMETAARQAALYPALALSVRRPKKALRGKRGYRLQPSKLWENVQSPAHPAEASTLWPAHSLDGW